MTSEANSTTEMACPQCGAPVPLPDYADLAVCAFCGSTLVRERPPLPEESVGHTQERSAAPPADATASPADTIVFAGDPTAAGAAVSAPAVPEEAVLRSVRCPQCVGPLGVREGRRILVCRHCGTRVAVRENGGVSRWYFPTRVERLEAASLGARWLSEHPGITPAARESRLIGARLVYAPIWEYRTLLAGWEFGYKMRTQTELVASPNQMMSGLGGQTEHERLELRLVKERVKEPRLQERRFYQEATDFRGLEATRPRVTGRELLLPLLAGELDPAATVLEVDGTASVVVERGRKSVLQPLTASVSPEIHLFTFRESISLLYQPLWLLRFQAGEKTCRIVVNGRDGTVNSAFAPADNRRRLVALGAQVLAAVVIVAVLIWLAATRTDVRMSMAALAVIVSVVVVVTVARFRTLGEVEYHEPFSG